MLETTFNGHLVNGLSIDKVSSLTPLHTYLSQNVYGVEQKV